MNDLDHTSYIKICKIIYVIYFCRWRDNIHIHIVQSLSLYAELTHQPIIIYNYLASSKPVIAEHRSLKETVYVNTMRNDIFGALDNLNEHDYGSTYYSPERKEFVTPSIPGPDLLEIYLPVDSERDFKNPDSIYNRIEMLKNGEVECIHLYANPIYTNEHNIDKIENRIYVQLPKEIDDIFYIPIILKNGKIDFVKGYHKYFLRAFDKYTRHLILGYIYVHGYHITSVCRYAGTNKGMFSKDDILSIQSKACKYRDKDAPKRINLS